MKRTPSLLILLALVSWPMVARGGIADSPLPVLQAGATTLFLYSVPGIIDGGDLSAFFLCTSTDTAPQQVGVEIFPSSGGGPCNDAVSESVSVAPGVTVKFGTGAPNNEILGFTAADSVVACGPIGAGSARILSTSKKLICTAFVGDRNNEPPSTSWQLTIIAKLKQKAAN